MDLNKLPIHKLPKDKLLARGSQNLKKNGGKPGRGKPTKYSAQLCQAVYDLLDHELPFRRCEIASAFEVTDRTFFNWTKDHPDFAHAIEMHRQKLRNFYENCLKLMAAGKIRGNVTAAQFALRELAPDDYVSLDFYEPPRPDDDNEIEDIMDFNILEVDDRRELMRMFRTIEDQRKTDVKTAAENGKIIDAEYTVAPAK